MFSPGAAYRKSSKGTEAIAARLHGLTPRLRSLLIVVDGKKSGQELLKFAANLGDADAMVNDLLSGGFIEPVPGSDLGVPATPAPAPVATPPAQAQPAADELAEPAAPQRPSVTLPEAKRLAVRRLVDLMGPMADDLCIGIESAKNPDQFMNAVRKAHNMIQAFRGEDAASKFSDEVEANFP
jgi:hypothetical protein